MYQFSQFIKHMTKDTGKSELSKTNFCKRKKKLFLLFYFKLLSFIRLTIITVIETLDLATLKASVKIKSRQVLTYPINIFIIFQLFILYFFLFIASKYILHFLLLYLSRSSLLYTICKFCVTLHKASMSA